MSASEVPVSLLSVEMKFRVQQQLTRLIWVYRMTGRLESLHGRSSPQGMQVATQSKQYFSEGTVRGTTITLKCKLNLEHTHSRMKDL